MGDRENLLCTAPELRQWTFSVLLQGHRGKLGNESGSCDCRAQRCISDSFPQAPVRARRQHTQPGLSRALGSHPSPGVHIPLAKRRDRGSPMPQPPGSVQVCLKAMGARNLQKGACDSRETWAGGQGFFLGLRRLFRAGARPSAHPALILRQRVIVAQGRS